jgi:predicted thioesterase
MTMKQSVIIHRPAEDIFTYMIASEHMVDWSSVVIAVRTAPSGPIQGGTTLRITTRFLGQWRETSYEVIECQAASHLTFKGMTGIVPCVFACHLDATETGTIVSLEARLSLTTQGWMLGLTEAVLENIVKRQLQHDLLTLKDVLEVRAV